MPKRKLKFQINPNFGGPKNPKPLISKEGEMQLRNARQTVFEAPGERSKLRVQQPEPQMEQQMILRGINNQQKKVKERSTPPPQTSETRTSASTGSTSTSITPQQSTTTTSTTSSTMANGNRQRSGNRNNRPPRNDGRSSSGYDRERQSGIDLPSTSFNSSRDLASDFYPSNSTSGIIKYSLPLKNTLHPNIGEAANIGGVNNEKIIKLKFNFSSFYDVIQNSTQVNNPIAHDALSEIFAKLSADIYSDARSSIYSNWTLSQFKTTFGKVCKGIEYLVCLDSKLAYKAGFSDFIDASKDLENYQSQLATPAVLSARTNLRRALSTAWFFPEWSKLILWFYQNYSEGPSAQSCAYCYLPDGNFSCNNGSINAALATTMDALADDLDTDVTSQMIWSMLCKIHPKGQVKDIPGSSADIAFDPMHLEIFLNEPTRFNDARTTPANADSSWPISKSNSDLPYYSYYESNDTNGLAFILQCVYTGNGSANQINSTSARQLNSIRNAAKFNLAQSNNPTLSVNKWYYQRNAQFQPRMGTLDCALLSNEAHSFYDTGTATTVYSKCPLGFQRLYFNNETASNLQMKSLIFKLTSLPTA